MAKVIIFGVGQIADVAHFYLTHDSHHDIAAFTVDRKFLTENVHLGLPVVPFEEVQKSYPPTDFKMFVPMSYRSVNRARAQKYQEARNKQYSLISYISSRAVVWPELVVGDNCFVLEHNVIQPFARIGDNVTLWSGNHIGHHSSIGDHCFVASHVVVSGDVTIEPYCFIGVNATLRDGITISRESVIGAGALVLRSTKPRGVYAGAPARLSALSSDQLRSI